MLVQHIPSSKVATANKVARLYTGPQDPNSPLIQFMNNCSRSGEQGGERMGLNREGVPSLVMPCIDDNKGHRWPGFV